MSQFADMERRRAELEAEMQPLNDKHKDLRDQITNFNQRRTGIQVCAIFFSH
jgi:predicted  nucleic acid-binding Zn-ribbon protein